MVLGRETAWDLKGTAGLGLNHSAAIAGRESFKEGLYLVLGPSSLSSNYRTRRDKNIVLM